MKRLFGQDKVCYCRAANISFYNYDRKCDLGAQAAFFLKKLQNLGGSSYFEFSIEPSIGAGGTNFINF